MWRAARTLMVVALFAQVAAPPPPPPPPPAPVAPMVWAPPPPSPAGVDLVSAPPPRSSRPIYSRGWFWGTVVVAATLVGGTIALAVALHDDVRTLPEIK